jgi:glucan phosphoethanolaminetransferase (alkaline phosphatase superfamily)
MFFSQRFIIGLLLFLAFLPNLIYSLFINSWENPWENIQILIIGASLICLPFIFCKSKSAFYWLSIFVILSPFELLSLFTIKTRISFLVIADFFLTNTLEFSQLTLHLLPLIVVSILPAVAYFILLSKLKENKPIKKSYYFLLPTFFSLVCIGQFIGSYSKSSTLKVNLKNAVKTTEYYVFPANVIYNTALFLKEHREEKIASKKINNFHFNASKTSSEKQIIVYVIGESSRAKNWSLFGYARKTNPKLERQENIYTLTNTFAGATGTYLSIPMLLSRSTPQDPTRWQKEQTIVNAFKESGFQTAWFGGQSRTFTTVKLACKNANYVDWKSGYDNDLIEKAKKYIHKTNGNIFVIIHLDGNHFDYKEHYPKEFDYFQPSNYTSISLKNKGKLINAYDNSIRYTDYILNNLIDFLKLDKRSSAVYFTSDHGENLYDDSRNIIFHGTDETPLSEIHVPTFIWLSNLYTSKNAYKVHSITLNKDKAMSTSVSFHTVLDLANITYPNEQKQYSVTSNRFREFKERYVYTPYGTLKKIKEQ